MTSWGAIVLAGGASRRMGAPKATLEWGGVPLIAHVVNCVRPCVATVVVSAAPDQELPAALGGATVVRDRRPDLGPLEGFCASLQWLCEHRPSVTEVFLTGCDAPLLTSNVVQRVLSSLGQQDAAVPLVQGQRYPLLAGYRTTVLATAQRQLAADQRRFLDFVDLLKVSPICESELRAVDPELDALRTCNTREEYLWAQSRAACQNRTAKP